MNDKSISFLFSLAISSETIFNNRLPVTSNNSITTVSVLGNEKLIVNKLFTAQRFHVKINKAPKRYLLSKILCGILFGKRVKLTTVCVIFFTIFK